MGFAENGMNLHGSSIANPGILAIRNFNLAFSPVYPSIIPMPTAASILKTRYQALVAPGNDAEFFRLLTEADERLLFAGRWHWAREPLSLSVVDGVVTLPDTYHSIVGARINGHAVGVNWQESEWFEGGPGEFIPVDGAAAFLVDQGLAGRNDAILVSGSFTPEFSGILWNTGQLNGMNSYSARSLKVDGLPPAGDDAQLAYSSDLGVWAFTIYGTGGALGVWLSSVTDEPDPTLLNTWTSFGAESGTPEFSGIAPRRYKLTSTNADITTVDILARYKPAVIDSTTDLALCPLPSALKQMMLSIIFEEANDSGNAEAYRAKAIRDLNEHEAAYRGSAKRVFKPSQYRPARRRSRHNFP